MASLADFAISKNLEYIHRVESVRGSQQIFDFLTDPVSPVKTLDFSEHFSENSATIELHSSQLNPFLK
tara:strand:+ start:309 stop:512 length:204 start_codon:yes stop_codon:yes gene_type:complete